MRLSFVLAAMALPLAGCSVEQTEEGELPEVEAEGGNLPEYDVDAPDVDVSTSEETITTPDVDVSTDQTEVEVPTIEIDPAEETEE